MRSIIVAGIGTNVGKTVASAVLVQMLGLPYWKPISCGADDSARLREVAPGSRVVPETYTLHHPVAPREAALRAGLSPELTNLEPPTIPTVIEMAGGVLVPIDTHRCMVDCMGEWDAEWVVVVSHYIGSINHTLLTLEALRRRHIEPLGVVFNGTENVVTEEEICTRGGVSCVGRLFPEPIIDAPTIWRYSEQWKQQHPWKWRHASLLATKPIAGTPIHRLKQPTFPSPL